MNSFFSSSSSSILPSVRDLQKQVPFYGERHFVKPGITGWAQVNGRDALGDSEKVAYELEYIKRHSIFLDAKILFLTIVRVISRRGITH